MEESSSRNTVQLLNEIDRNFWTTARKITVNLMYHGILVYLIIYLLY